MTESKKRAKSFTNDMKIFINPDSCTGCGICAEVCPFGLPEMNESGKFFIKNPEQCVACSACQRNCPVNAILLEEQIGCGCLWDARARLKSKKKGETISSTGCGCGSSTSISCCGESITSNNLDEEIKDAFDKFIKPNLGSCCAAPSDEEKEK